MNILNFSDNIIRLRHKKKITQEQLADFIGVTKASVSKWETGQSMPDVLLLPKLAAFFDFTIDELLGYEPWLSKEQIQKIYHELAAAFAEEPFDKAMEKSKDYVKKYYSCYPFLFQICVLWLNHFPLANDKARRMEVLVSISDLCQHIISGCKDIGICGDAVILSASVDLQLGKAEEVINTLEEILNPYRLSTQSDSVLIQAYMIAGKKEEADKFTQMSMFLHLLNLAAGAVQYISLHCDNPDICAETIKRMESINAVYDLEHLHPNAMAQFWYQAAAAFCIQQKKQKALSMLKKYAATVNYLLAEDHLTLHGDDYFYLIHSWYEQLDIGTDAPVDKRLIYENYVQSFENPVFELLADMKEYQKLKQSLTERGEL